jgi:hypothetical protein
MNYRILEAERYLRSQKDEAVQRIELPINLEFLCPDARDSLAANPIAELPK